MAQIVDFGGFLDLTRLVDLVMGSNLVQTASSTSMGMLEAVKAAIAYNITNKTVKTSVKATVFAQK